MSLGKILVIIAAVCAISWVGGSCGKETGQAQRSGKDEGTKSGSTVASLAQQASAGLSIDDDFMEGRRFIEDAGFAVTSYREFPAQEVAKRGRVLVYADKRKKHTGGVLFLKKTGAEVSPAWHWYFEDAAPDSALKTEINRDGLWDIRIVFPRGKAMEFIQNDSFTLFARERSDWIAMNGESSPPISEEFALWKCFDGDTATAWKSPVSGPAFIEVPVPFGVKDGVLTLGTLSSGQPDRCVVYADGNRVEEVKVEPVSGLQVIALGAGVRGATRVRLEFPSIHGEGGVAAVAELGLK